MTSKKKSTLMSLALPIQPYLFEFVDITTILAVSALDWDNKTNFRFNEGIIWERLFRSNFPWVKVKKLPVFVEEWQDLYKEAYTAFKRQIKNTKKPELYQAIITNDMQGTYDSNENNYLSVIRGIQTNNLYLPGISPLFLAHSLGRNECLLQIYQRITEKYPADKRVQFWWACALNQLQMAKQLAETHALNLSHRNDNGDSPLHAACRSGHLDVVRFLVEKGADVEQRDRCNRSPLHSACLNGHLDVVKYLVENCADLNQRGGNYGLSLLHSACLNGHLDVVKYLVENGADLNQRGGNYGLSPLHYACNNGHLDVVKFLVENGADVEQRDRSNRSPLHTACLNGHLDVVKYLVENGADLNQRGSIYGLIPLHSACDNGHLDVVKFLVENGADLNQRGGIYGLSPLHSACNNGHLDVVRFLVENGADVNHRDHSNKSPLHSACDKGRLDVVNFLVENGADVNQSCMKGLSPLDFSYRYRTRIFNFLKLEQKSHQNPASQGISIHQFLYNELMNYSRAHLRNRYTAGFFRFCHGQWGNHYGDLVTQIFCDHRLEPFANDDDVIQFFRKLKEYANVQNIDLSQRNRCGKLASILEYAQIKIGIDFDNEASWSITVDSEPERPISAMS